MAAQSATPVATFSIVAADLAAGDVGVAVASKFLAAGAVVPWASAGAGAVATQAFANASYGPEGLAMMRAGASASETMQRLIADDPDRDRRQFGLVDARGEAAAHTGKDCFAWAGHVVGEHFACQGNILTGAETVAAMAASFRSSTGRVGRTSARGAHGRRGSRRRPSRAPIRGALRRARTRRLSRLQRRADRPPRRRPRRSGHGTAGASSTCRTSISDRARRPRSSRSRARCSAN